MSYASIIQKDLPLAVWELEEAPSSSAACDKFLGSSYNGSYPTAQVEKKVPLIFGSSKSVQITGNSSGYALQIPSLDRVSIKSKNEPFSIEFWLKFYSSSFSAPTTITKILGKPNSETGIYIHNSSVIAIIGDTAGNIIKATVQVPNIKKPLHIVMSYFNNTVYLSVNGQTASNSKPSDVITKSYSSGDEYFRFIYPGSGLEYTLDHIAYYSRVLDQATIRRHIAYGLGYEIPNQVARFYGGYRYNMSMVQTPIAGKYEKGDASSWGYPSSVSNMTIEKGYLRIKKYEQPKLKYAIDKTSSVFTWDATSGLMIAAGGYCEIPFVQDIAQSGSFGIGFGLYKASSVTKLANGTESTLAYIDNQMNGERYVRFYLVGTSSGEDLKVQIDNNTPVTLLSNASSVLSGNFSCGFYYSATNQELTTFAGYNTTSGVTGTRVSTVSNSTFYPESIRLCSSPVYSNSQSYANTVTASEDKRFLGGIKRITHFTSVPSTTSFTAIQSAVTNTINNYVAEVNTTEKRFVLKAIGSYEFNISLKKLAANNLTLVGNHRIEWGSSSGEITVTALGKGYSTEDAWLSSTTLLNNSTLGALIDEDPGTSKFLNIVISVNANDIEENPTKIYYFRIVTYPTTLDSSLYTTTMICDGPDININSTAALPNIPPVKIETPFLFDEEQGGLYVSKTATIAYANSPISSGATSGLRGISFFANLNSGTTKVFTITDGTTTYNLTYNGSTLTCSGGTIYVNGSATSSATAGIWNHIVITFGTRLIVSSSTNLTITFGVPSTGTANFYLDEIMTLDSDSAISATNVTTINNLYKGIEYSAAGDTAGNKIMVFDSESYNGSKYYQPVERFVSHLTPVDFVTTTKPGNYTTLSDIYIDGKIISPNSRILVTTGADRGIWTVASTLATGSAIITGSVSNPENSVVYVVQGSNNASKYYKRYNEDWYETMAVEKIRSYGTSGKPTLIEQNQVVNIQALPKATVIQS